MTPLQIHIKMVLLAAETLIKIESCTDMQKVGELIEEYNTYMDDIVAYQFEEDSYKVDENGNLIAIF